MFTFSQSVVEDGRWLVVYRIISFDEMTTNNLAFKVSFKLWEKQKELQATIKKPDKI